MNKKIKILIAVFAFIYFAVMLWLLFLQREPTYGGLYNLIPFRVINRFIEILGEAELPMHIDYSLKNLIGNVVLFVPIGIFLPLLWKSQTRAFVFFPTSLLGIVLIEVLQWWLKLGMGDIDDVILNMLGASIGFCLTKLFIKKLNAKRKI